MTSEHVVTGWINKHVYFYKYLHFGFAEDILQKGILELIKY